MSKSTQAKIVDLQRQLKLSRDALTKICAGCRDPDVVAGKALDAIWPLDRKQPLQNLCGHEKRTDR